MATDILMQGKTNAWKVNEQGEALITSGGMLSDYDPVSSTVAYLWVRPAGTSSATASSQIKRFTFAADGGVTTECADGNLNFDNVWDDRLILSYS